MFRGGYIRGLLTGSLLGVLVGLFYTSRTSATNEEKDLSEEEFNRYDE
ncbi:hypothetical protein [Natranaerobius trueperi]|nr:hypothetical protein [Natranaerobius trueperi]